MWSVEDTNSARSGGVRLGRGLKYHAGREFPLEKRKIASSSVMDSSRGADFTMQSQRGHVQRKWEVLPGKNQVFDHIHTTR